MILTQKKTKSLNIVKDKNLKTIIMPTKLINQQDFLNQLNKWENYQFNLFFYLIDRICFSNKSKKENWENFKNSNLEIEIPINLIFSKQQIKNYIFRKENFETTKQKLIKISNLTINFQQNLKNGEKKIDIFPIFSKVSFNSAQKHKIIFRINKEIINEIDKFLDSFKIFKKQDLINFKISKLETRFRILLLRLRFSQNDKENFNKKLLIFPIEKLYSILKVPKKTEIRNFTQTILKPLIKKLNETIYFKDLKAKYEKSKLDNKTIKAVEFIIPNFNFVENENQERFIQNFKNEIVDQQQQSQKQWNCKKCNNNLSKYLCKKHFPICISCCSCSWH